LVNLAWSISPLRLSRRFHRARMRSCYFNQAASISLVLKNVPNGSSTERAFANPAQNRQINFYGYLTERFCMAEKPSVSGCFFMKITIPPIL
jgi:hypothetical protein